MKKGWAYNPDKKILSYVHGIVDVPPGIQEKIAALLDGSCNPLSGDEENLLETWLSRSLPPELIKTALLSLREIAAEPPQIKQEPPPVMTRGLWTYDAGNQALSYGGMLVNVPAGLFDELSPVFNHSSQCPSGEQETALCEALDKILPPRMRNDALTSLKNPEI